MAEERTFGTTPARVTIGLIDGHTVTGYLARFSPTMIDLNLVFSTTVDSCDPFATEHVAYVGFHRAPGQPRRRAGLGKVEMKVHVAGCKTFLVHRTEDETDDSLGFYATPSVSSSLFREIFFFRRSVRLLEVNLPFGEMLVREGKVKDEHLRQGLAEQQKDARIPIGQILIKNRMLNEAQLEQAVELQRRRGTRMGEVLIETGLVTAEDIEKALGEQRQSGTRRIGQVLIDLKLMTEVDMSTTLAKKFGLPFANLEQCHIDERAVSELPKEFINKHKVLPIDSDAKMITIAIADPLAIDTIDLVRVYTKKRLFV
jgi:type IV pilus assembly protein PilB